MESYIIRYFYLPKHIILYLDYYAKDKDRAEKLNKETDRRIITYLYLIDLD